MDEEIIERAAELLAQEMRQRLKWLEHRNDQLHQQVKQLVAEKQAGTIGASSGN